MLVSKARSEAGNTVEPEVAPAHTEMQGRGPTREPHRWPVAARVAAGACAAARRKLRWQRVSEEDCGAAGLVSDVVEERPS